MTGVDCLIAVFAVRSFAILVAICVGSLSLMEEIVDADAHVGAALRCFYSTSLVY